MVFQKVALVDGRGHLLGRMASMLAKELLLGQQVVVVRCEEINISGTFIRNKRTSARLPPVPARPLPAHTRRPARAWARAWALRPASAAAPRRGGRGATELAAVRRDVRSWCFGGGGGGGAPLGGGVTVCRSRAAGPLRCAAGACARGPRVALTQRLCFVAVQ